YCYLDDRYLPSFPTRRSSDLQRNFGSLSGLTIAIKCRRSEVESRIITPVLTSPLLRQLPCAYLPLSFCARHLRWLRLRPSSLHQDRKSTRLNSSHDQISYAVF